jgi:hypothetical protein
MEARVELIDNGEQIVLALSERLAGNRGPSAAPADPTSVRPRPQSCGRPFRVRDMEGQLVISG